MPIDIQRQQEEWKRQRGGDWWEVPEGDTDVYLCPPCNPDDIAAFYTVRYHYGVDKVPIICLDLATNGILSSPQIGPYLSADIRGGCATCEAIVSGRVRDPEVLEKILGQDKWIWNLIPIRYRQSANLPWSNFSQLKVEQLQANYTCCDGFNEAFRNEGDITRFDRAILVRVNRVGKGRDSRYKISLDGDSLRAPLDLRNTPIPELLKAAFGANGGGNIYARIGRAVKSRAEMEVPLSMLIGGGVAMAGSQVAIAQMPGDVSGIIPIGTSSAQMLSQPPLTQSSFQLPQAGPGQQNAVIDVTASASTPPACYGIDCSPKDAECVACDWLAPCADACGVELDTVTEEEAAGDAGTDPITAGNAMPGSDYVLPDGNLARCVGAAKGGVYFQIMPDGARVRLAPDVEIGMPGGASEPDVAPVANDVQSQLQSALARKAAAQTAAKPSTQAKSTGTGKKTGAVKK